MAHNVNVEVNGAQRIATMAGLLSGIAACVVSMASPESNDSNVAGLFAITFVIVWAISLVKQGFGVLSIVISALALYASCSSHS
jgi:hypothetical protein